MPARHLAIVNPASRNGATGRRWAAVEKRLRAALGELEVERTRAPRDAERIAREAVRAGVERLVVAGGDGTASEVASGLLAADLAGYAQIGFLPLGTGGDLARALGVPSDLDAAVEAIAGGETRSVDAGRITFVGRDGKQQSQYFLNVASFGISGLVDELVNQAPKALGGTFSFAVGTVRAIVRYRPSPCTVRVDGATVHEGPLVLAAAANGRYFGGGMHVAPEARPDDGQLDLIVVGGVGKLRLLRNFPSLYRGKHLRNPAVSAYRGVRIEAEAEPGQVWLDVDGEPLGTLPATIEVLPGAVTLFGTPA